MINQRATRDNVDKFLKTALPHFLLMRGMQGRELMEQRLSKKQLGKQLFIIYQSFNKVNPKYQPLLSKLAYKPRY